MAGKKKTKKATKEEALEITKVECVEGEEVEITEFPTQTTFNTEDMSIVEEEEE